MKKEIGLITENETVLSEFAGQVRQVFGNAVSIRTYSINDGSAFTKKREKLFLVSAYSAERFEEVRRTLDKQDILIPINLTFSKRGLMLLGAYERGTTALLVNVNQRMAEESIAMLYQAGLNHIHFIPYYPGCGFRALTAGVRLAFTPGETALVPEFIKETVDLGSRRINTQTMAELAVKLDCEHILETRKFLDLTEELFDLSDAFASFLEKCKLLRKELDTLTRALDVGVLGLDAGHLVRSCNPQAARLLGLKLTEVLGQRAGRLIPEAELERCKSQQVPRRTSLRPEDGAELEARLVPVTHGMHYAGAFAIVAPADPADAKAPRPDKSMRRGHVARYNFTDIVGVSPALKQTIDLAKMMAKTDSSVLITGESGTGKELFAHSIHNNSQRAQGAFIAINCAAIPDELLESELFGYEEGSFTGAKKGGKTGLFEFAMGGTLFLDEIEGMSQNLQIKLLRVIQEREIMRVGGDTIIPIDVRIISASNQELLPLASGGTFRSDLFYRLSALSLSLPPLRKRRPDIPLLIEEFKNILHYSFTLTEEAKRLLLGYDWPGNIRELRNCVEFFGCLNLRVIEPDSLPQPIQRFSLERRQPRDLTRDLHGEILAALARRPCGRKALGELLRARGILLAEAKLRAYLTQMMARGWIATHGGRGGSFLTEAGKEELARCRKAEE